MAECSRVVLSSSRFVLFGKKWKNSLATHRNRSRITPPILRTFRNHLIHIPSPQTKLTVVLGREGEQWPKEQSPNEHWSKNICRKNIGEWEHWSKRGNIGRMTFHFFDFSFSASRSKESFILCFFHSYKAAALQND